MWIWTSWMFCIREEGILKLITALLTDIWGCMWKYVITVRTACSNSKGLVHPVVPSTFSWAFKLFNPFEVCPLTRRGLKYFVWENLLTTIVSLIWMYLLLHCTFCWTVNARISIFGSVAYIQWAEKVSITWGKTDGYKYIFYRKCKKGGELRQESKTLICPII